MDFIAVLEAACSKRWELCETQKQAVCIMPDIYFNFEELQFGDYYQNTL